MAQTSMQTHSLHSFQVLAKCLVQEICELLRGLAILGITLAIEHPTPANFVSVIGMMTRTTQQRPAQSPAAKVVVSVLDMKKVEATPARTTTVAAKKAIPSLARTSSS
jgi:hypothetical protein